MSKIRDLFSKKLHVSRVEKDKAEVESKEFITEKKKEREKFIPPIDFASASNYIRFGSAKEYYANSIKRIYNTYPYDGSEKEILQFRNDSTELDKWMFDNKYPKANGHAVFDGTSHITINRGYQGATKPETTKLSKLFNTKVVKHNTEQRRKQTFALDLNDGLTIEWWMKKDSFSSTNVEGIFSLSSSGGYLDLIAYGDNAQPLILNASGSSSSFMSHNLVGTSGITSGSISDGQWHHYAVSLYRESSNLKTNLYIDGISKSIQNTSADIGEISDAPTGQLGLTLNIIGDIGLRADIDDFRFWNKKQSSKSIYNNYYRAIGGGANSDDNRTELSLYYKFNEGTTGKVATDRIVLDYSGRISNGYWESYTSACRETGSAYTTTGDPIIRASNTLITNLETEMELSGTLFDSNNNMSLYDLYPQWIQEEDNGELKKLTQIIAAYFDDLYSKIEYLPKLKDKTYFKDEHKGLPFAKRLLEEKGMIVPDILVERSVLEFFGQRDLSKNEYEKDIDELKNKIYQNIYNNIEHIYKSKGTEKSYRNLLRCFGIDDEVVKLNLYTDNATQYLVDKTRHTSEKTKHIDFDNVNHFSATVYQENYISGSGTEKLERYNAITAEVEAIVPRKPKTEESWYYSTPFVSSSMFGLDAVNDAGTAYDTTIPGSNFQAYLVRDRANSDRAKWVLERNTISTSIVAQSSSALIIDQSGEYYNSNINLAHGGSKVTITMWAKFNNTDSSNQRFFSIHSGSSVIGIDYNNGIGEKLMLRKHGSSQNEFISGGRYRAIGTVPNDEWILVGFVIDNLNPTTASDMIFFSHDNGGYRLSNLKSPTEPSVFDASGIQEVRFGDIVNSNTSMSGALDEVVIWNKALTQTDIEDIYNAGLQQDLTQRPDYSNIKYWLRLGGNLSTTVGSPGASAVSGDDTYEQHDALPYEYVLYQSTQVSETILQSEYYEEIYNNQRWNVAVRVSPEGYPFAGSFATSSNGNYNVEFYGVTHNMNEVLHEFDLSTTINYATGSALLAANKKIYVGARRDTWTGTVEAKSDLKIAAASVYYDRLDNKSIKQHNLDPSNYGHNRVHSSPTPFIKDMENTHLPAQHTLALHWDFQTVTTSDTSGEFTVEDFSSASNQSRYGWLDNVVTNEHKGRGYGFPISSTDVVRNEFIFASKKELPEISFTSDSVKVIGDVDNFLSEDEDVNDNVFAFEKSMYQSVSEEMLNMFSTITEYANLISKPVDKYRMDYKRLALARQLFFEKVQGNMDLDRFTNYFKWIDASISVFLQQLHPANAKFNKGIADMVESHILERPKYQHIYPFVEKQTEIKPGQMKGPAERLYDWKTGHSPEYKLEEYNSRSIQIEVGSYLEHSNPQNLTGSSGENSIGFWFEPSTIVGTRKIVSFGTNYWFRLNGANLELTVNNGSSFDSFASLFTQGQKTHIVVGIQTGGMAVFQDGASIGTAGATLPTFDSTKFRLGYESQADKFDEVSIWNKFLTSDDVTSIYNSGIAVNLLSHTSASNLVSYYRMGDHSSDPEVRPYQGYKIKDSTGNYDLEVKGTFSSYAAPLAGSFKVERAGENIHCLWQKERKERSNTSRRFIQKVITSETKETQLTFGDNSGNSYQGSTYASRRFSKPYRFKGKEQRTIHGGINYPTSKDRDFLKSATRIHGKLSTGPVQVPEEVVTVGAGLSQGIIDQIPCDDAKSPTKKEKLASNTVLGKYSDYAGTGPVTGSSISSSVAQYAFSVKGDRILPMNIIEATSTTGYNRKIHNNFRENTLITNLHSDTTSPTNDIPMQGPFAETWVGGRQSRHAPVNRGSDDFTTRPEEWRLLIGEHEVDDIVDGALGFTGPDYGGDTYPNPQRTFAIYYRDERAKRPVNVANRRTTALVQGNYSENYEIVQTVGRLENNKVIKDLSDGQSLLAKDIGLPATTNEATLLGVVPGSNGNILSQNSNRLTTELKAFPTWSTGISSTKSVFASRFSAPGGFDVMSEAYLDVQAKEYSVYNSLNFRNYSVIEDSGEEFVNIPVLATTSLKALKSPATLLIPNVAGAHAPLVGMPALTSATGFSVSTWVKLDDENTNIRVIYNDNTVSAVTGLSFHSDELIFRGTGGPGLGCQFNWSITYSDFLDWKHLCIAWDGDCNASVIKLYIDGVDQGPPTTVATAAAFNHSITDLYLFDRNSASTAFELKGSLHDFVFWDTNLSSPQVNDIYNSGNPKDYSTLSFASDLLIWWKLGEESNLSSLQSGDSIPNSTVLSPEVSNITSGDLTIVTDNLVIEDSNYEGTIYTSIQRSLIRANTHNNRREGLNTLHKRHCGRYGLDSTHGTVSATDYDAAASFHKIHRNTLTVPTSGSTRDIHNNFYVQTPIPSSDYNYSWVTSSLGDNYSIRSGTQKVYGYWPKTGILSSSSGFDSAITFPTASEIFGS